MKERPFGWDYPPGVSDKDFVDQPDPLDPPEWVDLLRRAESRRDENLAGLEEADEQRIK